MVVQTCTTTYNSLCLCICISLLPSSSLLKFTLLMYYVHVCTRSHTHKKCRSIRVEVRVLSFDHVGPRGWNWGWQALWA